MRWAKFSGRHAERSHHASGEPHPVNEHTSDPSAISRDYQAVAGQTPRSALVAGLAAAFRDPDNEPFAEIVVRLFRQSGPDDRAALLARLLGVQVGSVRGDLAGLLGPNRTVKPEDTLRIPVEAVRALAEQARRKDPAVIDSVAEFVAEHPPLAKILDIRTLSIAMARIGERFGGIKTRGGAPAA